MLTTALAALVLSTSSAAADDLALAVTLAGPSGVHERAVTLHDVQPGPQTGLVLQLPGGERYLFEVDMQPLAAPPKGGTQQLLLDMRLSKVEVNDDGATTTEVISQPRVVTMIDQPAMVQVGAAEDDGQGGQRLVRGLKIEMTYVSN